jgi:hypothetical protein
VYYCSDKNTAKQYFYLKSFPEIFPIVAIIDPQRRIPLKMLKDPSDLIPVKSERPLSDGSYVYKTHSIVFYNKIAKDVQKMINQFMDDEAPMVYESEQS